MNKVIRELADICKEHRFDEKLLFVPSYSIGHQIGESLTRSGHPWVNLRPTTVSGFAQRLVGPNLAKDGIRLIDAACRVLKERKVLSSPKTVMILSDFPLSGIEKDIVRLAGGDDLIVIGHEPVSSLRYPRCFSGAPRPVTSKPKDVRTDIELLPFLFQPEEASPESLAYKSNGHGLPPFHQEPL
ncbi:MAG: hypothetical protein JW836_11990 [Deltaproteobacteria bacterium]|nr:hypothetical protein [Deltaproteobacteria bacterium]